VNDLVDVTIIKKKKSQNTRKLRNEAAMERIKFTMQSFAYKKEKISSMLMVSDPVP
jgi:hypothetical protein